MVPLSRPGRIGLDLMFALMQFYGAIATIQQRILTYLIIALTVLEFTADLIVELKPKCGTRFILSFTLFLAMASAACEAARIANLVSVEVIEGLDSTGRSRPNIAVMWIE